MALDHPLARLRERLSLPETASLKTSVSVVICTRDRPEQLERCLHSLQRLSQQPQEIIVVDNAPKSAATRRLVARMPGVRYVLEPQPGLGTARNTGIRNSTGEIIAFTDDDVTVHPDWLIRLERTFENPEVMAVTGLVLPSKLETKAQLLFERNHGGTRWGYRARTFGRDFFRKTQRIGVPVWHIGAGANMAFRRRVFESFGGFDERLGAGASGCSEDSEMWYRVLAGGGTCRFEPTAVVNHYHRRDLSSLRHQMYQYMRGHMAALLFQFDRYRHWGNLYRAFGILPRYYAKLLLLRVFRGSRPRTIMLGAQILGCAAGVKFYLQHRHAPAIRQAPASGSAAASGLPEVFKEVHEQEISNV